MTDINTTIKTDLGWVKGHLILVGIVAVLVFAAVYGIESLQASHDSAREARDQQFLALVTNQTNDLKARMAQDEQSATVRDAQYSAVISQMSTTISKQTGQLQQQLKVNATLTAQETAQALTQKTHAQPGEVTAVNDSVTLALPIARIINSDLDKLSTTSVQLDETRKQLDAQTGLTTDAVLDATNAKKVITSQASQLLEADKVCKDEISLVKAQSRKGKMKWFGIGYLLGLASAHFIGV